MIDDRDNINVFGDVDSEITIVVILTRIILMIVIKTILTDCKSWSMIDDLNNINVLDDDSDRSSDSVIPITMILVIAIAGA